MPKRARTHKSAFETFVSGATTRRTCTITIMKAAAAGLLHARGAYGYLCAVHRANASRGLPDRSAFDRGIQRHVAACEASAWEK
jgi:hypothetical protein